MDFENPPKIKIRTFGDNIIELTGEKLTSQDDMVAVPVGVLIIPISEKISLHVSLLQNQK